METLRKWIETKYLSEDEYKKVFKMLDVKIMNEFSLHNDLWVSWQKFGTHKNVMNWVLLDNGYAVGWNENPGKGWSFPLKKVPTKIILDFIDRKYEYDREQKSIDFHLTSLRSFISIRDRKERGEYTIPFRGVVYTIEEIIHEIENRTQIGNEIRVAINSLTIDLLLKNK